MHLGVCIFATEYAIPIDELARETEARGFESLWVPEHTHIPTSRRSHGQVGPNCPRSTAHLRSLRVTHVCRSGHQNAQTRHRHLPRHRTGYHCHGQRSRQSRPALRRPLPVWYWGWLECRGDGASWYQFQTRFKKMGEQVRAMKEIWTRDVAEFHGDYVDFDPIWCWPKPAQQPHPPVLLGGEKLHAAARCRLLRRLVPASRQPELVIKGMKELQERAAKAGRDMQTISCRSLACPGTPGSSTPIGKPE